MTNKSKIINGVQHKQCGKCKQFKPLHEFHKLKNGTFGVKSECKKCSVMRMIEWGKNNHSIYLEKQRTYCNNRYKNDPLYREQEKERNRKWRQANPWHHKEWCKEHPDYHKEWAKNHPDYFKEWQRRFRKENPDHYRNLRLTREKA